VEQQLAREQHQNVEQLQNERQLNVEQHQKERQQREKLQDERQQLNVKHQKERQLKDENVKLSNYFFLFFLFLMNFVSKLEFINILNC
jgi:ABC-type lipoprotein release transport system permease subunit